MLKKNYFVGRIKEFIKIVPEIMIPWSEFKFSCKNSICPKGIIQCKKRRCV